MTTQLKIMDPLAKVYYTKFTDLIEEVIAIDLVYYNLIMLMF